MRVHVALKNPNGTIAYQVFDGVQANINARGVLEILTLYNKRVIAQYPPESFIAWRYVAPPPTATATSRAGHLLQQHSV